MSAEPSALFRSLTRLMISDLRSSEDTAATLADALREVSREAVDDPKLAMVLLECAGEARGHEQNLIKARQLGRVKMRRVA
jgi:hypothetical protein